MDKRLALIALVSVVSILPATAQKPQVARLADGVDYFVADTPGRDDVFARHLATTADTLVTPINDSFIDFDLIGQVDPESFQVTRPSFYSELIWDTRKARAKSDGRTIDWIILRNRLQHVDAHNMRRVGEALNQLSRRVGFRAIPAARRHGRSPCRRDAPCRAG